jgi:hypothetical protein
MLAMAAILCPDGVAFFASSRLGERLQKGAMTENAIAKQIVDAAYYPYRQWLGRRLSR